MRLLHPAFLVLTLGLSASGVGAAGPALTVDVAEHVHLVTSRIDATLAKMVTDGRIAGAEVPIWKDGREAYFG